MQRVVITGATGMIGSALARCCMADGVEVVALVRKDSRRMANLPEDPRLTVMKCALEDLGCLDRSDIGKADVLFHLGWRGTGGPNRDDVDLQLDNVRYAVDAARLAGRLGCEVFVGVGSQAEYGRVKESLRPLTPCNPENAYGMAKLAASQMTRLECARMGMRHEWARVLSVYGPRDVPGSLVMSVILSCLSGDRPPCTAGEQVWDYLFCDDCARALVAMARGGVDGWVYPLGSGVQRSLRAYIEDICEACGTGIEAEFGRLPYPPGQVMHLCADISTLHEHTGWQPTTSFGDGVAATVAWCRSHKDALI